MFLSDDDKEANLVELWAENQCLYETTSEEYKDWSKRSQAYQCLFKFRSKSTERTQISVFYYYYLNFFENGSPSAVFITDFQGAVLLNTKISLKFIKYSWGLSPIRHLQISHLTYLDIGGSSIFIKIPDERNQHSTTTIGK